MLTPLFLVMPLAAAPAAPALPKSVAPVLQVGAGLYSVHTQFWIAPNLIASPDGTLVAAGRADSISLYEPKTGRQLGRLDVPAEIRSLGKLMMFSPTAISWDGSRLLAEVVYSKRGGDDRSESLLLYDVKSESLLRVVGSMDLEIIKGALNGITRLTSDGFLPDGSFLVRRLILKDGAATWSYEVRGLDGSLVPSKWLADVNDDLYTYPDLAAGRLLTVRNNPGGCEVRDVGAGTRVAFLESCDPTLRTEFSLSLDGKHIAGRDDQRAPARGWLWETATGRLVTRFEPHAGLSTFIYGGAHLIDGDRLARLDMSAVPARFQELDIRSGRARDVAVLAPAYETHGNFRLLPGGSVILGLRPTQEGDQTTIIPSPWRLPSVTPAAPVKPVAAAASVSPLAAAKASPPAQQLTPTFKAADRLDDLAVIVGIESYSDIASKAPYAENDADAVKAHVRALGVPERNIVLLKGSKAGRASLVKYLEQWLPRMVKADSRVYFYFSGHGSPDVKTGQAYLVPWDGDPNFLESTAYPVAQLYKKLGELPVKQVLVAMDSCFSGAGGRSVLASGARPLVITIEAGAVPAKITVLAASAANEISGSLDDERHGAFTYFLLQGLDAGITTPKALAEYLTPRVQDEARRLNRDQTPQIQGDGSWSLR